MRLVRTLSLVFLSVLLLGQSGPCGSVPVGPNAGRSKSAAFRLLAGSARDPGLINLLFQVVAEDGTPFPGLTDEDFRLSDQGLVLASAFESDWKFIPRPHCFSQFTILVLDMSGSIQASGVLPQLQEAASTFAASIVDSNEVAIFTFDGREDSQVLVPLTQDLEAIQAGIDSLTDFEVVDNSTNLNGAVLHALNYLDSLTAIRSEGEIQEASVVLFTDGQDRAGRVEFGIASVATTATEHKVYTIGLGPEVNSAALRELGKSGVFFANDIEDLNLAFSDAAGAIADASNSYYSLAFCSARRSGINTLYLWLEGGENFIAFEFNADGFGGGCEPVSQADDQCIVE